MSFNFPASPSNGQTYTPVGGPVFTWDGTAWTALSQGMPVTVFVGDVAPTAPAFGNLWWESDTGNLYIYYNDGDSAQWVQVNGTPAGYQTADSRNRIVNGAMQISQENGTTYVSANLSYPADQFQFQTTIATTGAAKAINGAAASTPYCISTSIATAKPSLAAGDLWQIVQFIEGVNIADFRFGTPQAKPLVARFTVSCTQTGTFTFTFKNGAGDQLFMAPFTITAASTWQEFVIPIPARTVGTWPTDATKGAAVTWGLAAGSTLNAGAAGWGTTSMVQIAGHTNLAAAAGNFNIADVGLYLDPDNTGVAPKWQMPDEAEELRACQRYYENNIPLLFSAQVTTGLTYYTSTRLLAQKRTPVAFSGAVSGGVNGFANATGTFVGSMSHVQESRASTGTVAAGLWGSTVTANARM